MPEIRHRPEPAVSGITKGNPMSFLSQAFSFFVKEAPHLQQDLTTLNNLTKEIRDMISGLKDGREKNTALSALEQVAMQGFQAIVAHGAAAPKPTAKK